MPGWKDDKVRLPALWQAGVDTVRLREEEVLGAAATTVRCPLARPPLRIEGKSNKKLFLVLELMAFLVKHLQIL
jgi:hypothetical protein